MAPSQRLAGTVERVHILVDKSKNPLNLITSKFEALIMLIPMNRAALVLVVSLAGASCSWAEGGKAVLPIETVLAQVTSSVEGSVIGVELERERGRWVYEAKVVSPDGRLIELYIDAYTGAVISKNSRRKSSWD